jgi:hypothetical protein
METSDQMDQEPAIMVREPDATKQPTPHDNQLMSKHRVLSFKPQLRLEWRGQDGQNETEQPDHSASLGDSITSSTRIRFSVQTTGDFDRTIVVHVDINDYDREVFLRYYFSKFVTPIEISRAGEYRVASTRQRYSSCVANSAARPSNNHNAHSSCSLPSQMRRHA